MILSRCHLVSFMPSVLGVRVWLGDEVFDRREEFFNCVGERCSPLVNTCAHCSWMSSQNGDQENDRSVRSFLVMAGASSRLRSGAPVSRRSIKPGSMRRVVFISYAASSHAHAAQVRCCRTCSPPRSKPRHVRMPGLWYDLSPWLSSWTNLISGVAVVCIPTGVEHPGGRLARTPGAGR